MCAIVRTIPRIRARKVTLVATIARITARKVALVATNARFVSGDLEGGAAGGALQTGVELDHRFADWTQDMGRDEGGCLFRARLGLPFGGHRGQIERRGA